MKFLKGTTVIKHYLITVYGTSKDEIEKAIKVKWKEVLQEEGEDINSHSMVIKYKELNFETTYVANIKKNIQN